MSRLPVSVHDGLEDGGEWRHANAGGDQDGVLSSEYMARRRTIRTVYVYLKMRSMALTVAHGKCPEKGPGAPECQL